MDADAMSLKRSFHQQNYNIEWEKVGRMKCAPDTNVYMANVADCQKSREKSLTIVNCIFQHVELRSPSKYIHMLIIL